MTEAPFVAADAMVNSPPYALSRRRTSNGSTASNDPCPSITMESEPLPQPWLAQTAAWKAALSARWPATQPNRSFPELRASRRQTLKSICAKCTPEIEYSGNKPRIPMTNTMRQRLIETRQCHAKLSGIYRGHIRSAAPRTPAARSRDPAQRLVNRVVLHEEPSCLGQCSRPVTAHSIFNRIHAQKITCRAGVKDDVT